MYDSVGLVTNKTIFGCITIIGTRPTRTHTHTHTQRARGSQAKLSIRNPMYSVSFAKKRHLLLFTKAPTSFKISNTFSMFFKRSSSFFPVINMSSI